MQGGFFVLWTFFPGKVAYIRVVIVLTKDGKPEVYKSIRAVCRDKSDIRYHTVRRKKFPFTYKGYRFDKLKVK